MIDLPSYNVYTWEFPGGPVVRILCFHCQGPDSVLGQGIKILKARWHKKKGGGTFIRRVRVRGEGEEEGGEGEKRVSWTVRQEKETY